MDSVEISTIKYWKIKKYLIMKNLYIEIFMANIIGHANDGNMYIHNSLVHLYINNSIITHSLFIYLFLHS